MTEVGNGAAAPAHVRALELAYRYLNRRERSVHELREHLARQDLEYSVVEATIVELAEAGCLDDARYARIFTQDKRALEQWGSARIRRALLARGIEREVVDDALGEPGDGTTDLEDELTRALNLLQQRFPEPPRDRREHQRALGVLVRRGYEPELALDALAAHRRGGA